MVNISTVAIGSTNPYKIAAVEKAFEGKIVEHFVSIKTASGVNDQPVGLEETRHGALNRMNKAYQKNQLTSYAVGIENGLVTGRELAAFYDNEYSVDHWYDVTVVAMKIFKKGCQFSYVAYGAPLQLPNEEGRGILPPDHALSLEAKLSGYGKVIAPLIDEGKDLYEVYTEGKRSRLYTMFAGAERALSRLDSVQTSLPLDMFDTVITFGTFDHFHDLHQRLIHYSFKIGKALVVYVYNKKSKRKGKERIPLQDSVQDRIQNVARFSLECHPKAKVTVRRKEEAHLGQLRKAIDEHQKKGTVAVFGGDDQMCYEKMLDLCFETNTPVVTLPRGDELGLCSSDLREKLLYRPIADRYALDFTTISTDFWRTRIRSLADAKTFLHTTRYLSGKTAQIWKFYPNLSVDKRLVRPTIGKHPAVICLPGRQPCDLNRIRKIFLTNQQMLNLTLEIDYYLVCYREDGHSTKHFIDLLEKDPWGYFSDDAMTIVRDVLLPRIKSNLLDGVTFFTRSRGSVAALEVENAFLFCMKELGYGEDEIRSAGKRIKVISVGNIASLERDRLFSTVSFTGLNDRKALNYIPGFAGRFGQSTLDLKIQKISETHKAVFAVIPKEIKTYYPLGHLTVIQDEECHYTPLYISERVGGDNTLPLLIVEVFRNQVLKK